MGLLVDGKWQDKWYDTKKSKGKFEREAAQLRSWITPNGEAGPTGKSGYKAEKGRYHLYVSLACPWAHRTLIFRKLKELEEYITVSVVSPDMLENGWTFDQDNHSTGDELYQSEYMYQIYTKNQKDYSGRVTVPVLWDKKTQSIVSNESAEIIRMFNSAFNHLTGNTDDYYPEDLQSEIDSINEDVYHSINNGVYKCGFATSVEAYEKAYHALFEMLDKVELKLSKQRYLAGTKISEADWRLFTTLVRFDAVYVGHFKCNHRTIESYPHLSNYLRELYQWPGVKDTVNFYHIKRHYYFSHTMINPTQIVPIGPELNYDAPHNRDTLTEIN